MADVASELFDPPRDPHLAHVFGGERYIAERATARRLGLAAREAVPLQSALAKSSMGFELLGKVAGALPAIDPVLEPLADDAQRHG